jgi:hypothetical protein
MSVRITVRREKKAGAGRRVVPLCAQRALPVV